MIHFSTIHILPTEESLEAQKYKVLHTKLILIVNYIPLCTALLLSEGVDKDVCHFLLHGGHYLLDGGHYLLDGGHHLLMDVSISLMEVNIFLMEVIIF